jgi:hypothetical protein
VSFEAQIFVSTALNISVVGCAFGVIGCTQFGLSPFVLAAESICFRMVRKG